MDTVEQYKEISAHYPFFSLVKIKDMYLIGVVQNCDVKFSSVYVFEKIPTQELKELFLELCSEWWDETNREIPINIVMGQRFHPFKDYLFTFNERDFTIEDGHRVSLSDIASRKSKRKNVRLVYQY